MTDQRQIEFLYYKVNKAGVFQADVTEYVQAGTIRMDMDLSVKFQARFTIEETDAITLTNIDSAIQFDSSDIFINICSLNS